MRIIFDLDDTICHTENRDYTNAFPIDGVISRIKEVREVFPSASIVIHTSRGMASCNGDVALAEKKNRPVIELWLKEHGIEVDEIVFGKPLADFYVDDKAMSAADFERANIERYEGFSGARVARIGGVIVKECSNANEQYRWYKQARSIYRSEDVYIPEVYSATLGKLYMEYVEGQPAFKVVDGELLSRMISIMCDVNATCGLNDLGAYAEYVDGRARAVGIKTDIGKRIKACDILRQRTFCHGDFSLLNIIVTKDRIALIDPSQKDCISTWLLDAAKLRASILWLDDFLQDTSHDESLAKVLDDEVILRGGGSALEAVKLLEESHLLRVWYYAKKLHKESVSKKMAAYYERKYAFTL